MVARGYDDYQLTNNLKIYINTFWGNMSDGDLLYAFVSTLFTDESGDGEVCENHYIASIDLSSEEPEWSVDPDETKVSMHSIQEDSLLIMKGRLYFIDSDEDTLYSYDIMAKKIRKEADMPKRVKLPLR